MLDYVSWKAKIVMLPDLFAQKTGKISSRSCFVLMPFGSKFKPVFAVIKTTLEERSGVECRRADEIFSSQPIISDVWRYVRNARFLIADLTDRNPNVFYEVGLAHACGKKVILLTQDLGDVPFDLRHMRCLQYDAAQLGESFQKQLLAHVKTCISTTPVDWLGTDGNSSRNGLLRITALEFPSEVESLREFEILVKARNFGDKPLEGYCSLSFPKGVYVHSFQGSLKVKEGKPGGKWGGIDGEVSLEYPIVEVFHGNWPPGSEHRLKVRVVSTQKGLVWFFASASCREDADNKWHFDPNTGMKEIVDIDQRKEAVYCDVVEVT